MDSTEDLRPGAPRAAAAMPFRQGFSWIRTADDAETIQTGRGWFLLLPPDPAPGKTWVASLPDLFDRDARTTATEPLELTLFEGGFTSTGIGDFTAEDPCRVLRYRSAHHDKGAGEWHRGRSRVLPEPRGYIWVHPRFGIVRWMEWLKQTGGDLWREDERYYFVRGLGPVRVETRRTDGTWETWSLVRAKLGGRSVGRQKD